MLDIARAAKDGGDLYKENISELIKYVLPILIVQQLITDYYHVFIPDDLSFWLVIIIGIVASETLKIFAVYASITIFFSTESLKINSFSWEPMKLFLIWFTSIYIDIAMTLGYILLIVPGIIIMGITLFYPIYIVKFNQGPFESVGSSIDVAKKSWLRITALVAILALIWTGVIWLINISINNLFYLHLVINTFIMSIMYLYLYAITVSSWQQISNEIELESSK